MLVVVCPRASRAFGLALMLLHMTMNVCTIKKLLHLCNLAMRVESNQIHELQVIGSTCLDCQFGLSQQSLLVLPYFDSAVHFDSTAAHGLSPPPITLMISTRMVSTLRPAATRA